MRTSNRATTTKLEAILQFNKTDPYSVPWQEASFDRSSTMVSNANQLNLSETQVDELFETAMEIRT